MVTFPKGKEDGIHVSLDGTKEKTVFGVGRDVESGRIHERAFVSLRDGTWVGPNCGS